jgi:regulator of sigma E protease
MNSILAFIIVLGVLIVIHELGHFITAKLAGIAVPRFSIGLGPRVWGFTVGETEYVISALPLGGYVKMAGMGEDEALEALEAASRTSRPLPNGASSRSRWARGPWSSRPAW